MNVLITIGHYSFLLPNSTGVENMMRVLSKAMNAHDRLWSDEACIEVNTDPVKVEMKFVPPGTKFVHEKTKQTVEVWSDAPGCKRKPLPVSRQLKG